MTRPLRIAQAAPRFERVPPERTAAPSGSMHGLVTELDRRGHEVTTFASGDSMVAGRHIQTVPGRSGTQLQPATRCRICS